MKIKVLVNAYACSPDRGSEPGMGWNWCLHLANYCELHIITEEEFRDKIETTLVDLPQRDNMCFYYNPVPERVREMARNQGDWRFYVYYKKWQKKTLEIAKQIISEHSIDVIHQLNMIGFREPGYLWKIKNFPLIWGPIGGLKQFPVTYLENADLKTRLMTRVKNSINILQLKYDIRVNKAIKRSDLLISSIPDSYRAIKRYKKIESIHIPETGTFIRDEISTERFYSERFNVLWVGKFDFRKQLVLALSTIAATQNKGIMLHVYGEGNETQEKEIKNLLIDLDISDQVKMHGNKPNKDVHQAMREAQLFFFTSISEDTSTVVLEAISNQLPVLCFDACGFGAVIDETVGRKIPLTNPQKSIIDFAEQLNMFYSNRALLEKLSRSCITLQHKLSWDEKAKTIVTLYEKVISEFSFSLQK